MEEKELSQINKSLKQIGMKINTTNKYLHELNENILYLAEAIDASKIGNPTASMGTIIDSYIEEERLEDSNPHPKHGPH